MGSQATTKAAKTNEWLLKSDNRGHFNIRISREGTWFHEGTPITRQALVKLFASVLHKDSQGQHWLVTPTEKGRIDVEIAPLFITDLDVKAGEAGRFSTQLSVSCSTGERCNINSIHPLSLFETSDGEIVPVVLVRDRLWGHFSRASYYHLMDQVVEGPEPTRTLGIWSGGMFFGMEKRDEMEISPSTI